MEHFNKLKPNGERAADEMTLKVKGAKEYLDEGEVLARYTRDVPEIYTSIKGRCWTTPARASCHLSLVAC